LEEKIDPNTEKENWEQQQPKTKTITGKPKNNYCNNSDSDAMSIIET